MITRFFFILCFCMVILGAPCARAGFQWTPPQDEKTSPAAPLTPVESPSPVLATKPLPKKVLKAQPKTKQDTPKSVPISSPLAEPAPLLPPQAKNPPMNPIVKAKPIEPISKTERETQSKTKQTKSKPDIAPVEKSPLVVSEPMPLLPSKTQTKPIEPIARPKPIKEPIKPKGPAPLVINPFPLGKKQETPQGNAISSVSQGEKGLIGFGKDVPLALALRDVIPSTYAFSFGAGAKAKLGQRVTWTGNGRPWNSVLNDMLIPLGLSAQLVGNVVVIDSATLTH